MKGFRKKYTSYKKAFTLIEMSITVMIIAILISGSLMVFASNLHKNSIKTSARRIDTIYQAMGNYLLKHQRLPCPASLTDIKSQSTTYGNDIAVGGICDTPGTYSSTTSPDLVYGMVPVKDLGLSNEIAEDGFGSKFSYVVHKHYTKATSYVGNDSFGTSNAANITIKEKHTLDKEITNNAVFAIISHGANKLGAFNANSNSQNSDPVDSEELINFVDIVTNTTASFNNEFYVSSKTSDEFDDYIFFKDRNALISDFNVFSAIPCKNDATNHDDVTYSSTTMTWPDALYGQIVPANENCPLGYNAGVKKPTKRCGFNGQWEAGVVNPCVQQKVESICTGGTMVYISGFRIVHVFTSNDTFECSHDITAEIFAIGGGGGGGGGGTGYYQEGIGGGGGGGEYVLLSDQTITSSDSLTITIGTGGSGGTRGVHGGVGGNTTVSGISGLPADIIALGGNGGGHSDRTINPIATVINSGAPGGGSCGNSSTVQNADKKGGYRFGGDVDVSCGGGASQDNQGGNGFEDELGGAGGAGFTYFDNLTYGSGGGGGVFNNVHTNIGLGGGPEAGNGAWSYINMHATSGISNRGGGGGGGGDKNATNYIGGNGGSGVVIISFEY